MDKINIGVDNYKVRSYQMDMLGRLTLKSIAGYLQESAGNHANRNGFGYLQMSESGLIWVLTRLKIIVHSYPVWGEELELNTWVVNREKFFSRRDFEIKSKNGDVIIAATTGWMLLDATHKRPQLVDNFPMNIQMYPDKLAVNQELTKLNGPKNIDNEAHYKVKYSDLDVVRHVNNIQYLRIILDTFAFEYRSRFHIKSFEINYLSEALINQDLKILTANKSNSNDYQHEIVRMDDGSIICRAESYWEKD